MIFVRPVWKTEAMARHRKSEYAKMQAAFNDLGWPVPTPQSFHHWTLARQVDQLVTAREAEPDLGFMARLLALCSLPRTNPGRRIQYKRANGPFTLYMTAGGGRRLPYGNLPRILLAWVSTEAVRTQSRDLILGRSLSEFMRRLDISNDSGAMRRRLRNQMERLFGTRVELVYEDENSRRRAASNITTRSEFWWDPKRPDAPALWDSKIRLGEDFFNEIVQHPVPLDMNILKSLKRSSLGLDLYMWLSYRTFTLKKVTALKWRSLYGQFGAHPSKADDNSIVQDFRKDCLRELKKIKEAWPELRYDTARGVLIVMPSVAPLPPPSE